MPRRSSPCRVTRVPSQSTSTPWRTPEPSTCSSCSTPSPSTPCAWWAGRSPARPRLSPRAEEEHGPMDPSQRRAGVAALFDQLATGYDQGGVPWFGPIGARLVELTGPQPGDHALDIGAGRGAATFPLLEAGGPPGPVTPLGPSPPLAHPLRPQAPPPGRDPD